MGTFHIFEGGSVISPGLILAVMLVLVTTQTIRVLSAPTVPYVVSLVLAAVGLLAAEVIAIVLRTGGPPLGVLHPVADILAITATQIGGSFMIGRRVGR